MIEMGIDSLKIEGRMKSIHYIATVVSVYRKVIDSYCADPENFVIKEEWLKELDKCANRDTAPAFFEGTPGYEEQMFGVHGKKTTYDFAGLVLDYDEETKMVTLQQRNFFKTGDEVEFSVRKSKISHAKLTRFGTKKAMCLMQPAIPCRSSNLKWTTRYILAT